MKIRFFKHWLSLTEDQKLAAFKDERIYRVACLEVSAIGCPTSSEGIEKLAQEFLEQVRASKQMEQANEYIKLRMKVFEAKLDTAEAIAVESLANDEKRADKVHVTENLLRRVIKSGSNG